MMLKFRPVNCDTREPVDAKAGARARASTTTGGASTDNNSKENNNTKNGDAAKDTSTSGGGGGTISIYSEGPSAGWKWMMYADQWSLPIRAG